MPVILAFCHYKPVISKEMWQSRKDKKRTTLRVVLQSVEKVQQKLGFFICKWYNKSRW